MHKHLMSFHWDASVGEFIFPGLQINGTASIVVLSLVLIVICVFYEGMKVFQTLSKARAARERLIAKTLIPATETDNLLASNNRTDVQHIVPKKKRFLKLLAQATIFLCHNVVGYLLMLVVMVYNAYVFLAVVFGLGLGYFLFGHISMKNNMENIRARTNNAMQARTHVGASSGIDNRASTTTNISELSSTTSSVSLEDGVATHL